MDAIFQENHFADYLFQKQPPEAFYKISVSENFAIFAGKHLWWINRYLPVNTTNMSSWSRSVDNCFCFYLNLVSRKAEKVCLRFYYISGLSFFYIFMFLDRFWFMRSFSHEDKSYEIHYWVLVNLFT